MSIFLVDEYKEMEPYVPGEQPKDKLYIKLNANETSMPPSPKVFEALSKKEIWNMGFYADPHCRDFRRAIADVYGLTEDEVFVGNGADEVLSFILMSFFRRGMKIYFPDITYGFYRTYAKTYGLDMEEIPVREDLSVNIDDYMDLKGDIVMANPNNPTGLSVSVDDIERLVAKNPERMVIIDEAYVDYSGETCLPLVERYPNLVVVRTFSKSRNMAGMHVGFAVASKEIVADLNSIKFSFNPFNMNSLTMAAGIAAVKDTYYFDKCVKSTIENRENFKAELEKLGFEVIPSKANFVFCKSDAIDSKILCDKLKEEGILTRHFADERLKDHLRITIGTEYEMMVVLIAIKEILEEARENDKSGIKKVI
ncbi:MAG: histidinol-phosphate transaminase [Butyrivibrio sp.]|uniref:histidinol-phosphate transaminase n=1 Tax=Butyrivibrio sp. TaxID=28121 RepID=UPI0025EDEEB3|nr:histidinol-phosphate transaminase [Butyrivibrio sp.]MCR5770066.1 histidinol-phosphate transaminase [Butyrivibrio sp.]